MAKPRKLSTGSIRAQRIRLRIFGFIKEYQTNNDGAWPTASRVASVVPELKSLAAVQYHMKFLYNAKGITPYNAGINFINKTLKSAYASSGYVKVAQEEEELVALDEIIKD